MTGHWRSSEDEPPTSAWLRGRWSYGQLYVLDVDNLICDPSGERGLLIEWKRASAFDKSWRITQTIAERAGWWSALFTYELGDCGSCGHRDAVVTSVVATVRTPEGVLWEPRDITQNGRFEQWVLDTFGKRAA